MSDLSGKVALITGASRGVGRVTAVRLASLGTVVALNYSDPEVKAEEVHTGIGTAGGEAFLIQANVSEEAGALHMFKGMLSKENRVNILVNNAGITYGGLLIGMKEARFNEVLKTNLHGAYFCMQQTAKRVFRQKNGRVVNTSSYSELHGNAGQMNYAVTRVGFVGVTKTAVCGLGSRDVIINVVAPGFIGTNMTAVPSDKLKETTLSGVPLGRMSSTDDVAAAAVFLTGNEAPYIIGQVPSVDGGLSI